MLKIAVSHAAVWKTPKFLTTPIIYKFNSSKSVRDGTVKNY